MGAYCAWRWLISELAHLHCSWNCWIISWNWWTTWDFWMSSLLHSPAAWSADHCVQEKTDWRDWELSSWESGIEIGVVHLLLLLQTSVMSGTKLTQLFLFNPSWGPREGQEEEKVVLHWPDQPDETWTNKCLKRTDNLKHRHRRNVTSHHSLSLL